MKSKITDVILAASQDEDMKSIIKKSTSPKKTQTQYLSGFLVAALQMACSLCTSWYYFFPSMLYAGEEILYEDNILFLAEIFQVGTSLIQSDHSIPIAGNVFLQVL